MERKMGGCLILPDQKLTSLLDNWSLETFGTPNAQASIVRNAPEYPGSIFIDVIGIDPLDVTALAHIFSQYDPEGEYDFTQEVNLDGTYISLPEKISTRLLCELIGKAEGFHADEVQAYHSAEGSGIIALSWNSTAGNCSFPESGVDSQKKLATITAVENLGDELISTQLRFLIDPQDVHTPHELTHRVRLSVTDYLNTAEGTTTLHDQTGGHFDYGDVAEYVPAQFFERHGLCPIPDSAHIQATVDYGTQFA